MLSDSRQLVQGGVGPIPLSEMFAYMEIFRIDDLEERERFIKMMKALDRVFIKHAMTKMKAEREKSTRRNRPAKKGKRAR